MKERLGLTEIRKQANRMSFGEVHPPPPITPPPFPFLYLRSPTNATPPPTGR